jgi:hypothetical protein
MKQLSWLLIQVLLQHPHAIKLKASAAMVLAASSTAMVLPPPAVEPIPAGP